MSEVSADISMDVSGADAKNNASKRVGIVGELSAGEVRSSVNRTGSGSGAGDVMDVNKTDVGGSAGGKTDVNETGVGGGAGSDWAMDRARAGYDGGGDILGVSSPLFFRALPEASHILETELSLLVREHEKLRLELDADREARRTLDDRIREDEQDELVMREQIRQLRAGEREARGHIDRTMRAYPREALKHYVANQIRLRTGSGVAGGNDSLSELSSAAGRSALESFLDGSSSADVSSRNLTAVLGARALAAHRREPLKRA